MGIEYNNIREECESRKEEKEEEICMEQQESFYRQIFGTRRRRKVPKLGSKNGGHVINCLELLKAKEASFQACRRGRLSGLLGELLV
jgi:hypothetical protein